MTNSELVTQAIAEMNADRERQAQANIRQIIGNIIARQEAIKKLQAELADLKKSLAEVKIEPVNAADIVA